MKKITFFAVFAMLNSYAQNIGIGTSAPEAVLHVDAGKNNAVVSGSAKYADDVVITKTGNLGIGNNAPATRLDIRSQQNNDNAVGIGYSSATAAAAGAGAVRYNPTEKTIEFSDGTNWIKFGVRTPRDFVLANQPATTSVPNESTLSVVNWAESKDVNGNFDPVSGLFTVKYKGVYIVSLVIGFTSGTIADNSTMEVVINSSNNSASNIPQYRCLISFPGNVAGSATNTSSGSCSGIFNLNAGDTINAQVLNNLGATRDLDPQQTQITIFGL